MPSLTSPEADVVVKNCDVMIGERDANGCSYCCAEWLSRRVEEEGSALLLDCRSLTDYNMSHVIGARHLALPSLMLKRLQRGTLTVRSLMQQQGTQLPSDDTNNNRPIVLYDNSDIVSSNKDYNDSSSPLSTSSAASVVSQKLRDESFDAKILDGGFQVFHNLYPHLCTCEDVTTLTNNIICAESDVVFGLKSLVITPDHTVVANTRLIRDDMTSFPVQVLPFLYLGNAANSADVTCLRRHDIRYVLNVTRNVPNSFAYDSQLKYMQIPVDDHWSQNIASYFQQAASFIDEARNSQCGVLIHCLAGLSRSVTVTVAYIMYHLRLSMNEAYDLVRRCKPNISPNLNFMGQLLEYEKSLQQLQQQHQTCAKEEDGLETNVIFNDNTVSLVDSGEEKQRTDDSATPSASGCSSSSNKSPSLSPVNFVFHEL